MEFIKSEKEPGNWKVKHHPSVLVNSGSLCTLIYRDPELNECILPDNPFDEDRNKHPTNYTFTAIKSEKPNPSAEASCSYLSVSNVQSSPKPIDLSYGALKSEYSIKREKESAYSQNASKGSRAQHKRKTSSSFSYLKKCEDSQGYEEQTNKLTDSKTSAKCESDNQNNQCFSRFNSGTKTISRAGIQLTKFRKLFMLSHRHFKKHYYCVRCSKRFVWKNLFAKHRAIHSVILCHQCADCGKAFRWKYQLAYHMTQHSVPSLHPCFLCQKEFDRKSRLFLHLEWHGIDKPFPCSQCDCAFRTGHQLRRHSRIHAIKSSKSHHYCDDCGKTFKHKKRLLSHLKIHGQRERQACTKCGKQFKTDEALWDHMQSHKTSFPCRICGKVLRHSSSLSRHLLTHATPISCLAASTSNTLSLGRTVKHHPAMHCFICPVCKKGFIKALNLNKHLQTYHSASPHTETLKTPTTGSTNSAKAVNSKQEFPKQRTTLTEGEKSHVCKDCGKEFASMVEFTMHCKLHAIVYEYPCSECNLIFRNKQLYERHVQGHKQSSFQCPKCGLNLKSKDELIRHSQEFHKVERHDCPVCKKAHKTADQLEKHVRRHNTRRFYPCEECNRIFKSKNAYQRHVVTHRNEKDVTCPKCGKSFKSHFHVASHIRRVHELPKQHACQECGRAFRTALGLSCHVQTHGLIYGSGYRSQLTVIPGFSSSSKS